MKKCTLTRRRRKRFKKTEWNTSNRKVICNLHWREELQKSQLTLVLQARATMSDNKVDGPEDAIVSEMIKQLPWEEIYTITKCFQERARRNLQVCGIS